MDGVGGKEGRGSSEEEEEEEDALGTRGRYGVEPGIEVEYG